MSHISGSLSYRLAEFGSPGQALAPAPTQASASAPASAPAPTWRLVVLEKLGDMLESQRRAHARLGSGEFLVDRGAFGCFLRAEMCQMTDERIACLFDESAGCLTNPAEFRALFEGDSAALGEWRDASDVDLLQDLRLTLQHRFFSEHDAFHVIGGGSACVDRESLRTFCRDNQENENCVDRLFTLLGTVHQSALHLASLALHLSAAEDRRRRGYRLSREIRSRLQLGDRIDKYEFRCFCFDALNIHDVQHVNTMFEEIDADKDGFFSPAEFAAFCEAEAAKQQERDEVAAEKLRLKIRSLFDSNEKNFVNIGIQDNFHLIDENLKMGEERRAEFMAFLGFMAFIKDDDLPLEPRVCSKLKALAAQSVHAARSKLKAPAARYIRAAMDSPLAGG